MKTMEILLKLAEHAGGALVHVAMVALIHHAESYLPVLHALGG